MLRVLRIFFTFFVASFLVASPLFAQSLKTLYTQGVQAYQQGNYQKAIENLEAAVKVNSNFAQAYNMLGLAYREVGGNLKEIAWYFKTAVDINPKYVEALDNLGKAYYGLGEFDKAENYCIKALEINPDYTSAQFSLAWIYLQGKSKPREAIYYFKKAVAKEKSPNAYFGLGIAYFMIDNRAMVLDTITTLRGINAESFAEQLENIARDYYYVTDEHDKGSLVKITPPEDTVPSGQKDASTQGQGAQVKTQATDQSLGVTKVRMRGTFVDLNEEKAPARAKVRAQSTTSIVAQSQSGSQKSGLVTRVNPSSLSNKAPSGRRTIEVEGSGY